MGAHIKKRGKYWYLIDSEKRESLHTTRKALAEYRLNEYIKRQDEPPAGPTVKEYYEKWIQTKRFPLVRASCTRDYRQHFISYILSECGHLYLPAVSLAELSSFRDRLLSRGISLKTSRNVIDSSFRAMWRDAMAEGLVKENPFALLRWPRMPRKKPDPFTVEERDKICSWWQENDWFYFPWVFLHFHTGMRPSEAAALRWADIDLESGTISINKSRNMGEENATKTADSDRIIRVERGVVDVLKLLPSRFLVDRPEDLALMHVFIQKRLKDGEVQPMNAKKWAQYNWAEPLQQLEIRHRKFYATRHTFITDLVARGENLIAIKDYCGTSVAMIERQYCGRQELGIDRTKTAHSTEIPLETKGNLVAGPGFEPGQLSVIDRYEALRAAAVAALRAKRRA